MTAVAIIGSRAIGVLSHEKWSSDDEARLAQKQVAFVERVVARLVEKHGRDAKYVSGGARGVDRIAAAYLRKLGIEPVEHLPDWDGLGKRAAIMRNYEIVNDVQVVVAIWDGSSRGTMHAVDYAITEGKEVFLYNSASEEWITDPLKIRTQATKILRPGSVVHADERYESSRVLARRAQARRNAVRRM